MTRTDPELSLTEPESVFTAQFNREALSGEFGPAFAWLKNNELDPALMVAFQWALEPKTSVEPRPTDRPPSQSFVVPWPTGEVLRTRVDEIVAAYPWLEAYTRPDTSAPHSQHPDDGTVGQIPMYRLARGKWYVGRGRNSNVGLWDGQDFLVISEKFGCYVTKEEPYFVAATGCFQPFREIDEGRMVQPFGRSGWDAHYGHRLKFGPGGAPQGDG
jgi:hypothetical protein